MMDACNSIEFDRSHDDMRLTYHSQTLIDFPNRI